MMRFPKEASRRVLAITLCALMAAQTLSAAALAAPRTGAAEDAGTASLAAAQAEPTETVTKVSAQALDEKGKVIDVTVDQHVFTFSTVPSSGTDMAQYKLDSPYKTMALLIMALRAWTPENPRDCLEMLDYLTDTGATISGSEEKCPFSQYNPWISALHDRMVQNDKYKYIGNAYLEGAAPENNYTPTANRITLRQSVYDPYARADEWAPEQKQVLAFFLGTDNERYVLFFQDEGGNWKVYNRSWINLLADIKTADENKLYPPETEYPGSYAHPQKEPSVKRELLSAKAPGVDENGSAVVMDTTVEQYTYTFSTIPTCYEDIIQYKLDSPYKTMALLFLAWRTWTPDNPTDCLEMMDYLTNTNADSGQKDGEGHKLSTPCSAYSPWTQFVASQMKQNNKYRFIGNAYLGGASPENDYTPSKPITVTVRQSVYDPYKAAEGESPELKQILIHIDGADNDRYGLFYQDQRGDWRVFADHWKGLLTDVQTPLMDIFLPPETVRSENPAHPQVEPEEAIFEIPAKAPGVDDMGNPVVIDTTVKQHTFTFSTIPTCYEDIVQYKLDSPYKTMALMIMAFRTWTPENKTDCVEMMNYLTNTNVDSGKTDPVTGRKYSKNFSDYQWWTDFIKERMTQNNKYRYIGNAYLNGAMPSNDYTPTEPYTVTVRESVYNPYKPEGGHLTDPTLYQVLTTIPGADNDRYSIFYQDERGDYRVFSDNWKGLLTDVKTPSGDIPYPAEVVRSDNPAHVQVDPEPVITDVPGKAVDAEGKVVEKTVKQYAYTFPTVPASYEDIVQYKLDSPYKTMALLFLAFRTWTPEDPETCARMLDYLTNTATEKPGATDAQGHKLSYAFSEYNPWISFLKDRMEQNGKYRFIGNAYLQGASPANNYTPGTPVTVVVRQSVYDPFVEKAETTPELKQVLVSLEGADNDRYSLFYQDQRGDWRVFGDNWKGLLADVKTPSGDISIPPEVVKPANPAHRQEEPTDEKEMIPGRKPDGNGAVQNVELEQHTFTFTTVPTSYEDIVQYKLDSPYKTMALLFLAFRTWTPEHPETCAQMLDYLTHTAVPSGKTDGEGNKLSLPFSQYTPWISALKDRMTQNDKYRYIGNAYLKGASPDNGYTPDTPVTIVVRQSVYDPYKAAAEASPELKQILISIDGADSSRYSLFYEDERHDWRVFSDNWMGLLADVKEAVTTSSMPAAAWKDNVVSFRVENIRGDFVPYVAAYAQNGQQTAFTEAEIAGNAYAAQVPAESARCRIFLLDRTTLKPLAQPEELRK